MNFILYDILIAALLLFFLWRGYVKGFVLTLCGFLAIFVALAGATILSNILAAPVAKAIEPVITNSIHDAVDSYYQHAPESVSGPDAGDDWFQQLPLDQLLEPLEDSQLFQGLSQSFQSAVEAGTAQIVASAAQALIGFVAAQLARQVLFLLCFAAVLVAWSVLSRVLDLACRLPVLSTLNHWTGAAVGLLKGGLLVYIAVWLLKDLIPATAVAQSWLLRYFCTTSPLSLFL